MTDNNKINLYDQPNIWDIYEDLLDDDSLMNDRREYLAEDLCKSYGLDVLQGQYLYELIRDVFEPGLPDLDDVPPETYKEYFVESLHGGWEGFHDGPTDPRVTLTLMLTDLTRFYKSALDDIEQSNNKKTID